MGDWGKNLELTQPSAASVFSPEGVGAEAALCTSAASTATGTANMAVYVPITIQKRWTARVGYWYNGSAVSGTIDCGIYDPDMNRLSSSTPLTQAGTFQVQALGMSPSVVLPPGAYFIALAWSSATAQLVMSGQPVAGFFAATGALYHQTGLTAGTLPDPAAWVRNASAPGLPNFGITNRQTV